MEDYTHGLLEGQRHSGICKKKSVIQCRVCHVVLRSIHSSARNGLGIAPPSIALRPSSRPDNPPRLDWYWGISVLRPACLERVLIVAQTCPEYLIILDILSISILRPARLERVLIVEQIGLEYLIILDILRYINLEASSSRTCPYRSANRSWVLNNSRHILRPTRPECIANWSWIRGNHYSSKDLEISSSWTHSYRNAGPEYLIIHYASKDLDASSSRTRPYRNTNRSWKLDNPQRLDGSWRIPVLRPSRLESILVLAQTSLEERYPGSTTSRSLDVIWTYGFPLPVLFNFADGDGEITHFRFCRHQS